MIAIKLSAMQKPAIYSILSKCQTHDIPVLIDAEDIDAQPRINAITDELLSEYHRRDGSKFSIFKTYQMYRTDMKQALLRDINSGLLDGCGGIKLVRGAYYSTDRHSGLLYSNIADTHTSFNDALDTVLSSGIPAMIATHNAQSIDLMLRHPKLNRELHSTAQLLGMSDQLALQASEQVHTYKYMPYGPIKDTLPYLLRRLYENYGMCKYVYT